MHSIVQKMDLTQIKTLTGQIQNLNVYDQNQYLTLMIIHLQNALEQSENLTFKVSISNSVIDMMSEITISGKNHSSAVLLSYEHLPSLLLLTKYYDKVVGKCEIGPFTFKSEDDRFDVIIESDSKYPENTLTRSTMVINQKSIYAFRIELERFFDEFPDLESINYKLLENPESTITYNIEICSNCDWAGYLFIRLNNNLYCPGCSNQVQ